MELHFRLQTAIVCCLISISAAATCQPRPMRIPVDGVVLSNNARIRGAAVAVGTPPQNISFTMSNVRNETYVYGTKGLCSDDHSNLWCQSWRGGIYDPKNSSTAVTDPLTYELGNGFRDVMSGPNGTSLGEVGFGIASKPLDDPYETQAQLGLGLNSSLLHTLKDAGKIGSRSYSVYQGREGSDKAQGSLLLGGVDQALIGLSKSYTRDLIYEGNCNSGIKVTFNNIVLNFPNGTDASLFTDASKGMQACLKPSFPGLMTMPEDEWKRFQELTSVPDDVDRAYDINYRSILAEAGSLFGGDITFTMENAISIRIPNSELVVPEKRLDEETGSRIVNTTVDNLIISPLGLGFADVNDLPIMGRLFFAFAYLSVNQDAGKFTVWSAENLMSSGIPSIRALTPENDMVEDFCDGNEVGESPSQQRPSDGATPSQQQKEKSKLSGGAIGGIVLGGLAAIAAVLALILLFLRKKKKEAKANPYEGVIDEATNPPLPPYHSRPYFDVPSEMSVTGAPAAAASHTTKYAFREELEAPQRPQELDATYGRAM